MNSKKRNSSARAGSHGYAGAYMGPRVRTDHAATGYDGYKVAEFDDTAYSRVASSSYLQSSAIKSVKRRRIQRRLLIVLVTALALSVVAAGVALAYVSGISNKLSDGIDESLFSALVQTDTPEDPFYVLLLGTDKSEARSNMEKYGGAFRSDSIMLARVDPQDKKASIVSIPRDTLVELEGHGQAKINAARAYGGPTMAVQTVSELAGVPISHYAEIDFDGFRDIVDAVGGIEVNVPIAIEDRRAGGSLKPGKQTLTGKQALILCRSRHSYDNYGAGDLYRAANQRLVLSAIANKLLASDIVTIATSIQSLADSVTTDMKVDEIISVAQSMRGMDSSKDIYTATMPTTSQFINGGWYEIINETDWKQMVTRMDIGESPALKDDVDKATGTILASAGNGVANKDTVLVDTTATIRLRNGSGTDGVCADALSILEKMGYSSANVDVGNANNFEYTTTLVVYRNPEKATYAKGIAKKFKIGKAIQDNGEYLFDSDYLIIIGSDWKL